MRKILLLVFIANSFLAGAQSLYRTNVTEKTISVTGSAALEIVPDEIYLQVDLKEYQKKGKEKVDIDQIKKSFIQSCKDAGIADSCVTVYNYEGTNGKSWTLRKKKDEEDLKATISYWIKLNSPSKVDELVNRLDDDATINFFIAEISHSKIIEFRKQLKIQAIKAAKEKAIYLTEAINEKIGKAITINEPSEYYSTDSRDNYKSTLNVFSNSMANTNGSYESGESNSNVDFKKIKLRYEVSVVFALQ
jgi:uncharacterized protein YggE